MGVDKKREWLIDKIDLVEDPSLYYQLTGEGDLRLRYRIIFDTIVRVAEKCRQSGVRDNFVRFDVRANSLIELMMLGVDDCACSGLPEGENEKLACVANRAEVAIDLYRILRRLTYFPEDLGTSKKKLLRQVGKAWSWAAYGGGEELGSVNSKRLFMFLIEAAADDSRTSDPKMVSEVIREHDAACEVWQISQALSLIAAREESGPAVPCRQLIEALLVGFAKRISDADLGQKMVEYLTNQTK